MAAHGNSIFYSDFGSASFTDASFSFESSFVASSAAASDPPNRPLNTATICAKKAMMAAIKLSSHSIILTGYELFALFHTHYERTHPLDPSHTVILFMAT